MIVIGMLVAVASCFLTGIMKEPVIQEHDFKYSVTYKLDGEVKTLKDAQSKLQTSVSGLEASVKTINDGLAGKADKAAMETAIKAANDKRPGSRKFDIPEVVLD